jgi:hypothetical protein
MARKPPIPGQKWGFDSPRPLSAPAPLTPILGRVVPRPARWFDERPISGDACLAPLLFVGFVLPSDPLGGDRRRGRSDRLGRAARVRGRSAVAP